MNWIRYATRLLRTAADYEIVLPVTVTPLGTVSRLEHALGNFEGERERFRLPLADASWRLAAYQWSEGGDFAFAGELADKRRLLAEIEKTRALDVGGKRSGGDRGLGVDRAARHARR